jgi:Ca-activated chloride channel family protein
MTRSLVLALIPATLIAILLGCAKQDAPPAAPTPEQEARIKPSGQPGDGDKKPDVPDGSQKPQKDTLAELSKNDPARRDNKPGEGKGDGPTDPKSSLQDSITLGLTGGPLGGTGPALAKPSAPAGYTAAGGAVPASGPPVVRYAAPGGGKGKSEGLAAGFQPNFGRPAREGEARGGDGKPAAGQAQGQPAGEQAEHASNTERYGSYRENEFRSPLVAPLSTFSADVNTASYANVRRMLQAGSMPIKDSVFLAEFVNYFPYKYAQPKGEDPIEYNLEIGPCPWNRKHHLVRVGVQAYQIPKDKMPPRNLVFLVDTSGSMSPPNRLPLVRQSLAMLVDQLGEKDCVSVVTYAGDSRVALGPTKGSEKDKIKDVVTNLRAEGSTNGEGGIKKAYDLARETFIDGGVNRVILCTDGDFNVGVTNQGDLVRMIEEQRRSKVFLTILGFGMGNYKDETLKELANHGNGHHAYIDTIDEAKKIFVEQGASLVCVAKDVKFQVDFNPARVAAYRLIGYENRLLKDEDFRNDAKDAGDMGSGHQVTVLYEIIPVGVATNLPDVEKSKYTTAVKVDPQAPDEWLTVKMRYKQPEGEKSKELSRALAGKALGQELSDDFRFAAAAASFGMMLRDSQFRGAMTYAGVIEEAQGCLKDDPGGHRKEFLDLVKKAIEVSSPKANGPIGGNN